MPVLFKDHEFQGACGTNRSRSTMDVERLVTEVRDRLSIKTHERHSPSNRVMPYQRSSPCAICHCAKRHNSSPVTIYQHQMKKRDRQSNVNCISCRSGSTSCQKSLKNQSPAQNVEDARAMLEKLLAEQSLIQEAVRRLQTQTLKCFPPSCSSVSNSSKKMTFPFSSEDSIDTLGFTPSYSESEDDSLSQHSVDL
ncbi:hypothetical protein EGW08_015964 [Elysia chlorotica]|uniref:Uncharacterized protein n=1 Tax=Elysia chlorotica TaxID=188477 RepID=A0A433T421_ELYCH|nr:hypothetical protein EGW08_015964 [Elysia chlorotica]